MIRRLARSLSFRLLIIFLLLGGLFVYGTFFAIRWVYNSDVLTDVKNTFFNGNPEYFTEKLAADKLMEAHGESVNAYARAWLSGWKRGVSEFWDEISDKI